MEPTRILYIYQEIFPYTPENAVSKLCRELPQLMQETGEFEVRVFVPCFGLINERRNQLHEVQRLSGMNLVVNDDDHQLIIKVASIQSARLQIYFIDNQEYFRRKAMSFDENGEAFKDNDERMMFFTCGVLETIKKLRWTPNIIHCHGSLTSLAPLYVKTLYSSDPFYSYSKILFSIYKDKFENKLNSKFAKKLKLQGLDNVLKDKDITWGTLVKLSEEYSDMLVEGESGVDELVEGIIDTKNANYIKHNEDMVSLYKEVYKKMAAQK